MWRDQDDVEEQKPADTAGGGSRLLRRAAVFSRDTQIRLCDSPS